MDLDDLLDDITNSPQKKPTLESKQEKVDEPKASAPVQVENDWGEMEFKAEKKQAAMPIPKRATENDEDDDWGDLTPSTSQAELAKGKVLQQPSMSYEIKKDLSIPAEDAALDDWGAMKTPAPIGNKKFEMIQAAAISRKQEGAEEDDDDWGEVASKPDPDSAFKLQD